VDGEQILIGRSSLNRSGMSARENIETLGRLSSGALVRMAAFEQVKARGATSRVLNLGDTGTATGQLVFTVIGAIADDAERVIMRSVVAGVLSQLGSDGGALRIIPGHGGG